MRLVVNLLAFGFLAVLASARNSLHDEQDTGGVIYCPQCAAGNFMTKQWLFQNEEIGQHMGWVDWDDCFREKHRKLICRTRCLNIIVHSPKVRKVKKNYQWDGFLMECADWLLKESPDFPKSFYTSSNQTSMVFSNFRSNHNITYILHRNPYKPDIRYEDYFTHFGHFLGEGNWRPVQAFSDFTLFVGYGVFGSAFLFGVVALLRCLIRLKWPDCGKSGNKWAEKFNKKNLHSKFVVRPEKRSEVHRGYMEAVDKISMVPSPSVITKESKKADESEEKKNHVNDVESTITSLLSELPEQNNV